jgi:phosphate transport system substrate-binding protein
MLQRPFFLFIAGVLSLGMFNSCDQRRPDAAATITRIDSVTIYCDEAFRYLMDQEKTVYEATIPDKRVNLIYKPEAEVLDILNKDSFAIVIIGRRLRQSERDEIYKKSRIQVDEYSFAKDGIALIAGEQFKADTLPYKTLAALLSNTSKQYKLVFEGKGSGVISYMFSQFSPTTSAPSSSFAVPNTVALIDYLQKDDNAIGFIPFGMISDEDDSTARNILKKVKVLNVADLDTLGKPRISTASQSDIADGSYPFSRPINLVSHTMDNNVGTGFVNFLYKEQSGRIVLKSGLVPTIMPQRVINVNTDSLKTN